MMTKILAAQFDGQEIRRVYDDATEVWWFSVIDVVQVLTQQPDDLAARKYWNQLKRRLAKEGSQLVTNCHQLTARRRRQVAAHRRRLGPDTAAVGAVGAQPQGRTDQAVAGQGGLRAYAGNGRPCLVNGPCTPNLAAAWPQRQVDSAAHDRAGNLQQAD